MRHAAYVCMGLALAVALMVGCSVVTAAGTAASQEAMPWRQIQQNTAASFVIINYYPNKAEPTRPDSRSGLDAEQRLAMERMLNENTVTSVGVIISDTGEIFTTERELQYPQTVAKITVTGCDGKILPARADRLLVQAPGRVLRLTERLPDAWKVLKFDECDPAQLTPDISLYAASLAPDERNRVIIRPCEYGVGWNSGQSDTVVRVPAAEGFVVLCNDQGRPIGVSMVREIELTSPWFAWRGKDILADKGVSADEQTQVEDRLKKEFARSIYEMTIVFRPRPTEDGSGRGYLAPGGARDSSAQERLVYGLAFADDKVLVPGVFARETIEDIDTVGLKVGDKTVPARFGGVLRQYDAMVFVLEGGKLPQTTPFATDARLTRVEPFWAVNVRELAGTDVSVDWARWIAKEQGFAEKWYPVLDRSLATGSWLLDRQGRLVGLYGRSRRELDRLQGYLLADESRYASMSASGRRGMASPSRSYSAADTLRLVDAADLSPILSDLAGKYDTHIRRMDKDEQKRRMWLGVEYTRPSKEMVKQMNLRQETQDGRIGLVVNRVYRGSPAARLGLAEGDILLRLSVPEAPWPIDLITNERATYEPAAYDDEEDVPEEFRAIGAQSPRGRPWPSRDNYLTRMLGEIGAGTSVKVAYIHDGKPVDKEFVIEQSPPDMLAAAKYKNERLGLTVKDMTYEVRAALRLTENDTAVVVTEIEPGTAAAMARINRYELVRAVDSQAVDSVRTFEKLVTEAQQAQKESVRITVEWMGKTRLADLKFNAKSNVPGLLRSMSGGANGPDQ